MPLLLFPPKEKGNSFNNVQIKNENVFYDVFFHKLCFNQCSYSNTTFQSFFQMFLHMFTPSEIRCFKAGCLTEHPIENVLKNPN